MFEKLSGGIQGDRTNEITKHAILTTVETFDQQVHLNLSKADLCLKTKGVDWMKLIGSKLI